MSRCQLSGGKMQRHTLFNIGLWPFILLLILFSLFYALVVAWDWRSIEQDVLSNANSSLEAEQIKWATLDTHDHGRTVVINGTAASKTEADHVIDLVKSSTGVHRVEFDYDTQVVVVPETPASLNAIVTKDSIVLRGKVKDQATIDRLLQQAKAVFGNDNVVNKLEVTKNTAALANFPDFFKSLKGKGNTVPFSAAIAEDRLTLSGQVVNEQTKQQIGKSLESLTQLEVDNRILVVLPPPEPKPEPIKENVCLGLVQDVLSNGKINFATGKSTINEDSFELLDNIAAIAKRCPDSKFSIGGHTDSTGNIDSNIKLSEARAQAVVNHLAGLGLSIDQFKAVGFGPSKPVADNGTREGRAKNRRIEFTLQTKQNSSN